MYPNQNVNRPRRNNPTRIGIAFRELGSRIVANIRRPVICKKYCSTVLRKILFGTSVRFSDPPLMGSMAFEVPRTLSTPKRAKRMLRDETNSHRKVNTSLSAGALSPAVLIGRIQKDTRNNSKQVILAANICDRIHGIFAFNKCVGCFFFSSPPMVVCRIIKSVFFKKKVLKFSLEHFTERYMYTYLMHLLFNTLGCWIVN